MASLEHTIRLVEQGFDVRCSIEAKRCISARHRKSTCENCLQACPQGAISFEDGLPTVSSALCTGCGACASVCPTQAAELVGFSDEALRQAIESLHLGDIALFICAESLQLSGAPQPNTPIAHRHKLASGEHIVSVTVPCLARVDDGHLVHCAACGAKEIRLLSSDCGGCAIAKNEATVAQTAARCHHLCLNWGIDMPIRRIVDEKIVGRFAEKLKRYASEQPDRRHALSQVFGGMKRIASTAAQAELEEALPLDDAREPEKTSLAQILGFIGGTMPQAPVNRSVWLLDDLYQLQSAKSALAECERFGKVRISADCDDCGICARFCPTGALKQIGTPPMPNKMGIANTPTKPPSLEFRCSDCCGCGLCADICPKGAIEIDHELSRDELFDLEPTVLREPQA